jgi:hypothetical protein
VHIVLEAEFFKGDRDLVAVGGYSLGKISDCVGLMSFFSLLSPVPTRSFEELDVILIRSEHNVLPAVYKSMLVLVAIFAEDWLC